VHGFSSAIAHSPWWVDALLAVVVLSAVVRSARGIVHSGHSKDAVRRFSQAERRMIFVRAGNRCEHHFPIFGRCRATTGLEADHVHPHSRGGWTSVSNGQALCHRHNREKSARVPWNWQLNNLGKRRATYFVPGHDPAVVRHQPPAARAPKPAAPSVQEPLQ
jgi:5-methylcytosine-specific restriction endonuclease McrA